MKVAILLIMRQDVNLNVSKMITRINKTKSGKKWNKVDVSVNI